MATKILEINLISAQGLKPPSSKLLQMQTYAVVFINSSTKLRTRIDRIGGENPTFNDKFLFKVTQDYLSSETSGVSFEIYAFGCLRNPLIGTARLLISNMPKEVLTTSKNSVKQVLATPSFVAIHIVRPCGMFQGVLNVGVVVNDGTELSTLYGVPAVGYRDLMGKHRTKRQGVKKVVEDGQGDENSVGESGEFSDSADSSSSSSSSAASTTLKDWNGVRDFVAASELRSSHGGGLFCGLLKNRFSGLGFFLQP
ncbi:Calcium-dependent lipid-binding (CaLB domain) family protein [Euphorbia peplus]|nr:Calcium-dependent lipid-binding (CaLB domain) family protein [Euphorbia peplus]